MNSTGDSRRFATSSVQTEGKVTVLPFSFFSEGKELRFFLNVQKVLKVVEFSSLQPSPDGEKKFIGMYEIGGNAVPVIDTAPLLTGNQPDTSNAMLFKRIVICQSMGTLVGILVDRTRKIFEIKSRDLKAPMWTDKTKVQGYVAGSIHDEHGFSYMFDLETFLQNNGIVLADGSDARLDASAKLGSKRILFVDDSKFFQKAGSRFLEKHGAVVNVLSNGQEALEHLREHPTSYDLLLTDIEMPVMDGIELVRRLKREEKSPLPVLFHSSISNEALIADISAEQLGEYVLKFNEETILRKILDMFAAKKQSE